MPPISSLYVLYIFSLSEFILIAVNWCLEGIHAFRAVYVCRFSSTCDSTHLFLHIYRFNSKYLHNLDLFLPQYFEVFQSPVNAEIGKRFRIFKNSEFTRKSRSGQHNIAARHSVYEPLSGVFEGFKLLYNTRKVPNSKWRKSKVA